MSVIEIEIDNKKIKTEAGKMIIEVADSVGINIPRFCYHKKLSIVANCRMCLVEVEKAPKTLPACATAVADGMKIFTQSSKTLESQRAVMEFLLVNHPLDCPICDQGGECELQDVAMGYGDALSHYTEGKRVVRDQDLGPLIATDMTRCIHCTRCVRFGEEVAGVREMGATGRGEHMRIGTYIEKTISHELSGNIIDLCPVGALTSKPFRYSARAWELSQHASIAPHDCLGSNVYVHVLRGKVMRVVPKENEGINETWLSDRDRFSYLGLKHPDRLQQPMIKDKGEWKAVPWQVALNYVADAFEKIRAVHGGDKLGALLSPSSTTEEGYLLQRLMRCLGSSNIDCRLRQTDVADQLSDQSFAQYPCHLEEVERQDVFLLLGSNPRTEQPLLAHRIHKASQAGADVLSINMIKDDFYFPVQQQLTVAPSQMVSSLMQLAKALCAESKAAVSDDLTSALTDVVVDQKAQATAQVLCQGKRAMIIVGAGVHHHPQASVLRYWAKEIAQLCEGRVVMLTEGANAAGLLRAGAVPHVGPAFACSEQVGLDAYAMLKNPRKAYLLHHMHPLLDVADPSLAKAALSAADCVVAVTPFDSEALRLYAHVLLPSAPFTETGGSYSNCQGVVQTFTAVVAPFAESKPAWKIYRVLMNLLDEQAMSPATEHEVRQAMMLEKPKRVCDFKVAYQPERVVDTAKGLQRYSNVPIYAGDDLLRHAGALQAMSADACELLRMNKATAQRYGIETMGQQKVSVHQDGHATTLTLVLDECIPDDTAYLASATPKASALAGMFGSLAIQQG